MSVAERAGARRSSLVVAGLAVATASTLAVLAGPAARATNPCTSAHPPPGCPPLPPAPRHAKPVPPEVYRFDVTPGVWLGRVVVHFWKVRLDRATQAALSKPGSLARGYAGFVECSNGGRASAPARVQIDPDGPVWRGPDGNLQATKQLVVVPLSIEMPEANPAAWCRAWVAAPADVASTIDRPGTSISERAGGPLAVDIEAKAEPAR